MLDSIVGRTEHLLKERKQRLFAGVAKDEGVRTVAEIGDREAYMGCPSL